MSISISEGQARLIYLDYHTRGNTMGTSAQEMGAIVSQYADRIHTWQASVDSNQYEWDDSDYDQYIEDGKEIGMEATDGHTRKDQVGDVVHSIGDATVSAGGAVGGLAAKAAGASWSSILTIGIGIVVAASYWIKKPNKEGGDACGAVQNTLKNAQSALQGSQADMENMQSELVQLSDEASAMNDSTSQQIVDEKTEQEYYLSVYNSLKAKIASGKELTDGEKNLYKLAAKNINATGESINGLIEENQDEITDIYDSMGTYQEGYDYAAETIGEAQGLTDYTATFDKQTRSFAYVEGAAQTLNASVTGIAAGALILKSGIAWWNYVLAAAGLVAATSSGVAAKQQFDIAKTAGATIEQRQITEELNTATQEVYDVEIDNYAALMGGAENMEIAVPEENPTVEANLPASQTKKEEPKKPKVEESEGGK